MRSYSMPMSNSDSRSCCNTSSDNLGVLTHNSRGVVGGLRGLLTSGSHNLLAVLGDDGINNLIIFLMAHLSRSFDLSWDTCSQGQSDRQV